MAVSPPEYCRLFAQKKAYQGGGVTGTPGPPPSYAPGDISFITCKCTLYQQCLQLSAWLSQYFCQKSNSIFIFLLMFTAWQKQLMIRYGNEITLLDAIYKTMRYELSLFFLVVKTNVNYIVVGSFIIQRETTASIQEALGIFHDWNASWKPQFFMTDFCHEEIHAIENTFTGADDSTLGQYSQSVKLNVNKDLYIQAGCKENHFYSLPFKYSSTCRQTRF